MEREAMKMSREFRRAMPLLPISMVMQLTELTARQIRYYEEHDLIEPARSEGNRRMFSLDDVDALLEIRELLDQGINMAGIKKVFDMRKSVDVRSVDAVSISDAELRAILREEMLQSQRLQKASLRQGDLSRFFQLKSE
jgi:MerR family transcriptional regulator, glutamine synthetase repressor